MNQAHKEDTLLWLEEVEGEKAINWVKEQNLITDQKNKTSNSYLKLEQDALKLLEDNSKIPYISLKGDYVYNFWQDTNHVKGLWRRTSLLSYKTKNPKWDILLDVDKLAKTEKENWVFKGADCLTPDYNQCLVYLSRGGKDATVVREFNIKTKNFAKDGFYIPEAKSRVSWRDKNSLYVGTDFGKGSLTTSGYPKIVKIWQRNTPLSQAKTIHTGNNTDIVVSGYVLRHKEDKIHIVSQAINFYESKKWVIQKNELKQIPVQDKTNIRGYYNNYFIVELNSNWTVDGSNFKSGSVLAIKTSVTQAGKVNKDDIKLLMEPTTTTSIQGISKTKNNLIISTMENVRGKIYSIEFKDGKFSKPKKLPLGNDRDIRLGGANRSRDQILYYDEGFLNPRSLNFYDLSKKNKSMLKSLTAKFSTNDMTTEQRWTTSKDGTKIPYFVVGKKSVLKTGSAPTELYGYGGFNVSLKPSYNETLGKLWLEKGGIYALANIRGGGEFGPDWHQSAILKNKNKSYEDFISVAEHLISTGVTTNQKLAISGGSNGGLLVGAVMTKRPDLFKAVVCQVPLLDMMRYHKLLAGASWMAEYGNPDDAEMRKYILTYSPYQNVKKDMSYPNVLFMTSTKDDRVHPGHARKMAALMMEQGHKGVQYYENTEGGHAGSSNLKQRAKMLAIKYRFLLETL